MRINETSLREVRFRYLGRLPDEAGGCLFIHCRQTGVEALDDVVTSALEAKGAGFPILTVLSPMLPVLAECCLFSDNPLYVLLPYKDAFSLRQVDHDVFASGGGFIFPSAGGASPYALINHAVLELSAVVLFSGRADRGLATRALDCGLSVFLLRNSMRFFENRDLARAGCPVIGSLSDAVFLPKSISYCVKDGKYRIGNSRYGVFNF